MSLIFSAIILTEGKVIKSNFSELFAWIKYKEDMILSLKFKIYYSTNFEFKLSQKLFSISFSSEMDESSD